MNEKQKTRAELHKEMSETLAECEKLQADLSDAEIAESQARSHATSVKNDLIRAGRKYRELAFKLDEAMGNPRNIGTKMKAPE